MMRLFGPTWSWLCLVVMLVITLPYHGLADDAEDDGDGERPALATQADTSLQPGAQIDNVFALMVRLPGPQAACPLGDATPLLAEPLPETRAFGCVRLTNTAARPGIWRIDFEQVFGGALHFELLRQGSAQTVLSNTAEGSLAARVGDGRRLASLPIALAAGEEVELRVAVGTAEELADSDPVLRPERGYDRIGSARAHGFGGLFGASILLVVFYAAFARLLRSQAAWRYMAYFIATTLTFASTEGYLLHLIPDRPTLSLGLLDIGLEALQVVFHLLFIAAFLAGAVPDTWLARRMRWLTALAGTLLLAAAALSWTQGGLAGLIVYHDLGYELDPLLSGEGATAPLILGASATLLWLAVLLAASAIQLRRRTDGSVLFGLGAVVLVSSIVLNSLGEDLLPGLGDDHFGVPYVFLLDGLLFAAAMVRQTFGLRDQRDRALAQELAVTQDKIRLTETLLDARQDIVRARDLAEQHRSRLALTSHDLRQPLATLGMAAQEAGKFDTGLGERISSSHSYLRSVLDGALADAHPDTLAAPAGPAAERFSLQIVLSNIERMFADQAAAKGLSLEIAPSDVVVETEPIALIRMVANLVDNAIKYTPEGTVSITAHSDGRHATLTVADTGPGLTPAALETIFAPYRRGETSAGKAGEGLGLSSVQGLADHLGLDLQIDSRPGDGARFSITGLPAR